jgi:DNA polymerase-3 subunit delta'
MSWDMLGHEWAVRLLCGQIESERVRHAYLFTGPQGLGRRTLAIRFAKALNCEQPPCPGEPCGECRSCVQVERMQHPDLIIVQSEQRGGTLKVDQVRTLQRSLALSPYEARYKVALLLRFEEANQNAANALLKTLEEPSPQVVLILTAENEELLLPTIVSRCEVLRLRPVPIEQVNGGLQDRWGLPHEQAELLAHISNGRPGYAITLHQKPKQLEERQRWLDDHYDLLSSSRVERFVYAETLAKMRKELLNVLMVWLSLWRDVLLYSSGATIPVVNIDRLAEIEQLASLFGLNAAHRSVADIERTLELLDRNINTRLAMEVLMLDLPKT